MDTRSIFQETGKLGNEITKHRLELERINLECIKMMALCSHEIVFKYHDNKKETIDGSYFCPACGKTIDCVFPDRLYKTSFKDSRIIPLSNVDLKGTKKVYQAIRTEVYNNIDLYYNSNIPTEELSMKMENILSNKNRIIIKK